MREKKKREREEEAEARIGRVNLDVYFFNL
jgi:hypothetical protein